MNITTSTIPPASSDTLPSRVLLVDDEPGIVAALRRRIRGPWDVHTATSAAQGLEVLQQHACAVVVSDLHMPGMDGIEFFNQLHQQHPETIRIMLTGDVDRTAVIRAVNQGHIFRFLNKPCPAESVEVALEDGMEIHRLRQAQRQLQEQKLADAARMARVGELAGTVAGGLEQVIRLVQSNAAFAQLHATDANLSHTLRTIERMLTHGNDLTRQLTDLCGENHGANPPAGTGLRTLAEQLAPMLTRLAGPDLPVEFRCEADFDSGTLGVPVLGRILTGLVEHARTQTRGQGRLRVGFSTLEVTPGRARLHHHAGPGLYAVITVATTAGGTTRETAQTLYRALLDPGRGAGETQDMLSQIARLVSEHRGWIQVRSDVGKGTCIQVHLPKHNHPASLNRTEGHDSQA